MATTRWYDAENRLVSATNGGASPNILLSTFNCRLLTSPRGSFFASSRPTLPFTTTLVLRMRCSRVRRFLSEYPTFDFQLSTFNLPARSFLVPIPARNPFKPLHLQLSLDRDRNHVVIWNLIVGHQSGHSPLHSRHCPARAFSFTSFTSFASL